MKTIKALIALGAALFASTTLAQTKITFGYLGAADFTAAFVAKEEGYFKKRGLDVELQLMTLNSTVPAALQSNSIQIGTATPTVLLQAVDSGLDLVAIANATVNDNKTKHSAILAKAGSNIKNAQDLVGKKVGTPGLGAMLHVLTRRWLMEKGVDYKKVTFIETPLPQMNDLLKGGTVDAVIAVEPFMSRIEQAGTGTAIAHPGQDFPSGYSNVLYATTREWTNKNPAAVKAFQEALAEGIAFTEDDPAKARAHLGKYIKLPPQVLETLPIPKMMADLAPSRLRFWGESMRQQEMLRSDANLSAVVAR